MASLCVTRAPPTDAGRGQGADEGGAGLDRMMEEEGGSDRRFRNYGSCQHATKHLEMYFKSY